ncbi:phage protein [Vibrio sp. ZSDZ65]|uniref:Phage protein n=1 Tax=Vibrio qingdaonensis TaxID=2829491 RepID=A0A9X3CJF0_9VIBR|nr:phage protein [Vibrio qingdaonensis]MCW8344426.1 phage protein [Vibrio qingdaonensis]
MFYESFKTLYWREFSSVRQGAEFFHVNVATVRRWLDGTVAINPMAEKLLIVKSLGYLPNDMRWRGFRVDESRAVLITPTGREFSTKELESFGHWRDEYQQLFELHGHIDNVTFYPAKENVLPFRGGRRMSAAPWVPTKLK